MSPSFLDTLADRLVLPGAFLFTKYGYQIADTPPVDADLTGRVIVATGATSGLGKAAATELSAMGASLIIVGRDEDKTKRVRDEIATDAENDEVDVEIADLSLMEQVRALGNRLADRSEIHVILNVAGALFNERKVTAEGNEMTLATNLMSQFLLTNMLLDTLRRSAPARIVSVSSGGMYTQGLALHDIQYERNYDGRKAYARTKRGQVVLTELWARMLDGSGVVANSMHPGWADTPGVEDSLPGFHKVIGPALRTPEQGADTIVWLAAAPEAADVSGRFFLDRRPHITSILPSTESTEAERLALWAQLADLTGWAGPGPRPRL